MNIPKSKAAFRDTAAACEFLAFSFDTPSEALAGAVLSDEWVEFGDGMDSVLDLGLPDDWAFDLDQEAPELADGEGGVVAYVVALQVEAERLFGGDVDCDGVESSEPIAAPRENAWLDADAGGAGADEAGAAETLEELAATYAAAGFVPDESKADAIDHIATELGYLAYLARIAAGEAAPEDARAEGVDEADFPSGSARAAYREFAKAHVMTWMPRFADAVVAETRSPFYRAAAQALAAFLEK